MRWTLLSLALILFAGVAVGGPLPLRGTALSGGEFGAQNLPGSYLRDYVYPTAAEVDYFVTKNHMTVLRLPFSWERLQPVQFGALDAANLALVDSFVSYATPAGASVVLDPHNYARYYGNVIGSSYVTNAGFADFWTRLAAHYAGNSKVIFGLMNEPHDLPTEQWASSAQAAISAIRLVGATNLILVPGVAWTGAWSWGESFYGTPNAVAMTQIVDPKNNFAFEVHQYLDSDSSGTSSDCVSPTVGSLRLASFTAWLKSHRVRGFLGEFGAASNPTCLAAIDDELRFVEANSDVFLGWTWWSAGPWWGGYFMSIEPGNHSEDGAFAVLLKHLR